MNIEAAATSGDVFRAFVTQELVPNLPPGDFWAKLKDFVRRAVNDSREAFDDAIARAMDSISNCDIRNWFEHCSYAVDNG
ncbi:MAG: hypothetical protein U0174_25420 [Polyangiaceae bacterium]